MTFPGETIQILTAQRSTDPYSGESVDDWTKPPASVDVPDVLCEPRPAGEPVQDARNAVTSGWTLYCQTVPNPLPTAKNRVRVRGVVYEVDGEPADWRMGGWRPGVVVQAKVTEG